MHGSKKAGVTREQGHQLFLETTPSRNTHTHIQIRMCVYICMNMCICIRIRIYTYVYIHTYIHIYIYVKSESRGTVWRIREQEKGGLTSLLLFCC